MHVILDHIVDQKFNALEALENELETAEDQVLDALISRVSELPRLRKDLLNLRKSLFHEEILVKICRMDCPFINEKISLSGLLRPSCQI